MLFAHHKVGSTGKFRRGLRLGRRVTSWLLTSVFALNILVASAMPGAKAAHSDAETVLTVLCTPTGPQLVKLDGGKAPVTDEKSAEKICDFCLPLSKLILHTPQQKPDFSALNLPVVRLYFPLIDSAAVSAAPAGPLQPRAPPFLSA